MGCVLFVWVGCGVRWVVGGVCEEVKELVKELVKGSEEGEDARVSKRSTMTIMT